MHNTLLVIRNEKVSQSRGATCYSSGFTYHLCQLVRQGMTTDFWDDQGGAVMTGMTTNEWYELDGLEMTG